MTFHLGLIGYPLGHSLSPILHQAALSATGLKGDYRLFALEPGEGFDNELKVLINQMRGDLIKGLNVTIPHKQTVIPFLDGLSTTANVVKAVNTIRKMNGQVIGDNTDVDGFLRDLDRVFMESYPRSVSPGTSLLRNSLVLGAGGSARAVIFGLLQKGWNVYVAARQMKQAQRLLQEIQVKLNNQDIPKVYTLELNQEQINSLNEEIQLVVNTTSAGMWPNIDETPWPSGAKLPQDALVYDLVYNPSVTVFVRTARKSGLCASNGLGMLIEQAALSFEFWTGHRPDREALWDAVPEMRG